MPTLYLRLATSLRHSPHKCHLPGTHLCQVSQIRPAASWREPCLCAMPGTHESPPSPGDRQEEAQPCDCRRNQARVSLKAVLYARGLNDTVLTAQCLHLPCPEQRMVITLVQKVWRPVYTRAQMPTLANLTPRGSFRANAFSPAARLTGPAEDPLPQRLLRLSISARVASSQGEKNQNSPTT